MSLESAENERKAREAAESGDKATSNDTPLAPVPEGDAMDVVPSLY